MVAAILHRDETSDSRVGARCNHLPHLVALTLSLSKGERSRFDKLNVSALEQGFSH